MLSVAPRDRLSPKEPSRPFKVYQRAGAAAPAAPYYSAYAPPAGLAALGYPPRRDMDLRHMYEQGAPSLMDISHPGAAGGMVRPPQIKEEQMEGLHQHYLNSLGHHSHSQQPQPPPQGPPQGPPPHPPQQQHPYGPPDLSALGGMSTPSSTTGPELARASSSTSPALNSGADDDESNSEGGSGDYGSGDYNRMPPKKRPHTVPEDMKDRCYWEKRKKNNDSAKRSREARRMKEEQIAMRVVYLEQENLQLRTEVSLLKSEIEKLRCMLYNS